MCCPVKDGTEQIKERVFHLDKLPSRHFVEESNICSVSDRREDRFSEVLANIYPSGGVSTLFGSIE